jgi:hypothetical protein
MSQLIYNKYHYLFSLFIGCICFIVIINQEGYYFYIFISLLFIVISILSIYNFQYVLLLYLALYPITSHYLVLLKIPFDISFNRVFAIIIVIGYLINKKGTRQKNTNRLILLLYILSFIDVLASILSNSGLISNINMSVSFIIEVVIVSIIYYKIFNVSYLPKLIYSFSIGVFFLSVCGIWERFFEINLLFSFPTASDIYNYYQLVYEMRDEVRRIRGPFIGAVQYSGFGPLMIFCSLYIYGKKKVIGIFLLTTVTACLFFCISRTAIYLFGIYILLYLIITTQKKTIFLGFVLLLTFLVIIFPDDMYRAIDMGLNPYEPLYSGSNTEGRLVLINEGVKTMLVSNPFGLGSGEDLQNLIVSDITFMDMCNFFIAFGIIKGLLYVLIFSYIILYLLWKLLLLSWHNNDEIFRLFFVSYLATFIGLLSYAEISITLPILLIFYLVLTKNIKGLCYSSKLRLAQ